MKIRIKKNDTVSILSGKDRGKSGKVLRVFPRLQKILVEGVALHKRHRRPQRGGQKGEIVVTPSLIDSSNATLRCDYCKKASRIGCLITNGKKSRICKKCKNVL